MKKRQLLMLLANIGNEDDVFIMNGEGEIEHIESVRVTKVSVVKLTSGRHKSVWIAESASGVTAAIVAAHDLNT